MDSAASGRLTLPDRASAVLFDLDGTISQSGPAIITTLRETLEHLGLPTPGPDDVRALVGPPLSVSLRDVLGLDPDQIAQVIPAYRARQLLLLPTIPAYDGVPELIRSLAADGLPLAVATSKLESTAEEVIEAYGLRDCFVAVCGAPVGEVGGSKDLVVGDALSRLTAIGCDVRHVVMVGDRHHDVSGAAVHQVPTIAVSWGYGSVEEWSEAAAVARDPGELRALLVGFSDFFVPRLPSA